MFFLPYWFRWRFSAAALERQFLVPDDKVSIVDDLGSDVDPVFNLEIDEIRLSVLDLVEGWLLRCGAPDVSKRVVVINHRNEKRLASGIFLQLIVELELFLVIRFEFAHLLGRLGLIGMDLPGCLNAKIREFFFVSLRLTGSNVAL